MNVGYKSAGQNVELFFEKLHLICKLKFLTPWQLFFIFHSPCYPIFGSSTIFNSTFNDFVAKSFNISFE